MTFHTSPPSTINFVVSLAAFEYRLLETVRQDAINSLATVEDHPLLSSLFSNWEWAEDVKASVTYAFEEDSLEDFQGDQLLAYEHALHVLPRGDKYGQRLFRMEQLRKDNEAFPQKLANEAVRSNRIHFIPNPVDALHWGILISMVRLCPNILPGVSSTPPSSVEKRPYSIWKVVRKFYIAWRRPSNREYLEKHLFKTSLWKSIYRNRMDGCFEKISSKRAHDESETRGSTSPPSAGDEDSASDEGSDELDQEEGENDIGEAELGTANDWVISLLRMASGPAPISDPWSDIEFIPWSELENVGEGDIGSPVLRTSLRVTQARCKDIDARPYFVTDVFTAEALYNYSVTSRWPLPVLAPAEVPPLILRPLPPEFLEQLHDYWTLWSDCKLTSNPGGEIFLVEAISGHQFREICGKWDLTAARRYYETLALYSLRGGRDEAKAALQQALGSEYKPYYEALLRFIPPSEICDIQTVALASGANGSVHSATWRRPANILQYRMDESLQVVLKRMHGSDTASTSALKKFCRELDACYVALSGQVIDCIKFYGITRITVTQQDGSEYYILALVFERASEGTLHQHLEKVMKQSGFNRLKHFVDICESLANGLHTLHKRHFVHRDLHSNNVLVTKGFYPTEPTPNEQFEIRLSDLGEGKPFRMNEFAGDGLVFGDNGGYTGSVLAKFPPAPEVNSHQIFTAKSDIWDFGILLSGLLSTYFPETLPRNTYEAEVLLHLKSIARACTTQDPDKRITAREAIRKFEHLGTYIREKEKEL